MLPNWYIEYKKLIDNSVENYLTEYFKSEENVGLNIIKDASIYACNGGKRIRSILALEFYLIFSGKSINEINSNDAIIKFCIALELLHGYSLVHDDLPLMDNDDYRRGELTVWKRFGEANAVLVGDLLNSLSFEVISEIGDISLIKYFGKAVGINGMLGGQVLDLYYENNPEKLNLENLLEVHNKKTGALIEISISGGIIIANLGLDKVNKENKSEVLKYKEFGEKIGLAFQVKDDLLDVEGTKEETGKSVGDGEEKGFVYFLGLEKTNNYLDNIILDCKNIILKLNSEKLNFLVKYIGKRKK